MSSNILQFDSRVSIDEAVQAILVSGTPDADGKFIRQVLLGEPGIGKSSVLKTLKEVLGDKYTYVYIDAPTLDIGDVFTRMPDRETQKLVQYFTDLFDFDSGKPMVIMVDEYLKCPRSMSLMFTRMFLEGMVGDRPLPEGSIVFATSNNASDGVGDSIAAHVGNRVTLLTVDKPDIQQFTNWGINNNVSQITLAWLRSEPRALASYMESGQEDNPYIFNPKRPGNVSFVSPRSLTLADQTIIQRRDKLPKSLMYKMLAGTIGVAAAKSLSVWIEMDNERVPFDEIVKDPLGVAVPNNMGIIVLSALNAVQNIKTQDHLAAYMQYLDRANRDEIVSLFFRCLHKHKTTSRLAHQNKRCTEWATNNIDMLLD